jgi:putative iron-dependent peroxidase
VVGVAEGEAALAKTCSVLGGLDDLVKTVGFRDLSGRLSCIVGLGSDVWDRLHFGSRPRELKPFAPIEGKAHTAPATPGDLLFHIRAERADLCFEFERILLASLGSAVTVVDEVSGFRYFDARDLLGFVDGTANPTGDDLPASALVGDEDSGFAGGSYMVVQKYLHDLDAWARVPTLIQEQIIGRTKIDNIEIDGDDAPHKSHKSLATIVGADGTEHDILRDNMPFGRAGHGEFGTYFIGYSRYLWVIEKMLQRMYIGDPPGRMTDCLISRHPIPARHSSRRRAAHFRRLRRISPKGRLTEIGVTVRSAFGKGGNRRLLSRNDSGGLEQPPSVESGHPSPPPG